MDTQYAEPVRPEVYKDNPEFTSIFRPRIHQKAEIADHASVQCHLDLYGEECVGSKFGSVNYHAGNFTSLCAPNCLVERLALVSYTIEYAFIHDDETDNAFDEHSIRQENRTLLQALNQSSLDSVLKSEKARRKSEVQAKIAAEFLRLDRVFGNWFLSYWETFAKSMQDVRNLEFESLDDYLAYRVVDAAAIWTTSILRWGSGIYLTAEEERVAAPMSYVAYAALSLTNDLFSWEKEYKSHIENHGNVPLVNAVHIIQISQNLTQSAAQAVIRTEIRVHEQRYAQLSEEYKATPHPSESIIRWLNLLEDSIAGNFVWSLRVPRYREIDRNPYHDHLNAFGNEAVRVLMPPLQILGSATNDGDNNTDDSHPLGNALSGKDFLTGPPMSDGLNDELVLSAYTYINALPSKNVRQILISSLNSWYRVPEKSLLVIETVTNFLHNASLLLDDIQDGSSLRRGKPAAHQIFGVAQTINTATYLMNEALRLIQTLSESAVTIYSGEMRNLHIGQGHDLHWSYHTYVPTPTEYITMVDGSGNGRTISTHMPADEIRSHAKQRLMREVIRELDLNQFATILGRLFQIRDDLQNLSSSDSMAQYTQRKGFCDDFDEGKLSFPLILGLQTPGFSNTDLLSVLKGCHPHGNLPIELKQYLLEQITARGAFLRTRSVLKKLYLELMRELGNAEKKAGSIENWALRLLIMKLDVGDDGTGESNKRSFKNDSESVWKVNQQRAWAGTKRMNGR
ncbi:geranyl-geranyl pyrophosphate [Aspergillus sclerotialis]|uniref:Geranyl-geranyl pyrophosphate n=1 Tax=Aspergillus sclerotialis TaxID=2070753 RepID=A0A3A2ZSA8_9EURO|nr:geranyl-geranyl pyrophosphate [Aspergillus sclerotialis]